MHHFIIDLVTGMKKLRRLKNSHLNFFLDNDSSYWTTLLQFEINPKSHVLSKR